MKLIIRYLKNYKKILLLNVVSVLGFALVEPGIPTIVAKMIDNGVSRGDSVYIWRMGLVIVVISVVGAGGTILLGHYRAYLFTSVTRGIRNNILQGAQELSCSKFHSFDIAPLIIRTDNDAFQTQMFLNILLRAALMTPVMMAGSIFLALRASLNLFIVILVTIPSIVGGVVLVARVSKPLSENQQISLESINRISKENLGSTRMVRALTNDTYEKKQLDETNSSYMGYSKKLFKLMSVTQPIFFLLMNLAGMIIYWIASWMINSGTLQIRALVVFVDYLFHVMFSIMLFCLVLMMYPKAAVNAGYIWRVLETEPLIHSPKKDVCPLDGVDETEFNRVTSVYPGGEEAALKDVSFSVKRGETIVFIGSTGSGKSTLINLIPWVYDVSAGHVLINGTDIREYDSERLRSCIGFIPQKAMLFTGTIADNPRYGKKDADTEELTHAAKMAQAYDFIMERGGFDETITGNVINVSGGQRQRLSIARALVRRSDVYVFDDFLSALDLKTDAKLRRESKKETSDAIVMIVAQRISSIAGADWIIVLNEGMVVGTGTYRDLLKTCQVYREIALLQLSKEGLAHT